MKLEFTDEALHAVSRQAIERKAGARGLRSILEHIMLDVMYEIPSTEGVAECVMDESTIVNRDRPKLVREKKAS